jgi:hypothetical protein
MSGLEEKAKTLGRKAFITHIDGEKLLGKGYETTIWVQRDIEMLLAEAQKNCEKRMETYIAMFNNISKAFGKVVKEKGKLEGRLRAVQQKLEPVDHQIEHPMFFHITLSRKEAEELGLLAAEKEVECDDCYYNQGGCRCEELAAASCIPTKKEKAAEKTETNKQ